MYFQKLLERIFQIDSNTSATIIITLVVFILGYLLTSLGQGIRNFFLRKANRKLFLIILNTLLSSLNKRRKALEEQQAYLNIETFNTIPISKIEFFQAAILKSMSHKETFESFFDGFENMFKGIISKKKQRTKCFVKVWENLANIEFWENNSYESMKTAAEEVNRLSEEMSKPLNQLRILYSELLKDLNSPMLSSTENNFINELSAIVNNWATQKETKGAYIINEQLSKKLKALGENYHELEAARKLRNHAMDAIYWYRNIEVLNKSIQKSLRIYDHTLRYYIRTTKVIIKVLS